MKKSVVAISDENAEVSTELISILHDAGIAVRPGRLNASARDQTPPNNDPAMVVAFIRALDAEGEDRSERGELVGAASGAGSRQTTWVG